MSEDDLTMQPFELLGIASPLSPVDLRLFSGIRR
jgi:hypothetical protein